MSDALRDYIRNGRAKVDGWFHRVDAEIFALVTDHQNRSALGGSLVEIGLYQGKSFIALCLSLRDGQKAYGIDLFDDALTLDRSGIGARRQLEDNLRAAGVPLSAVILDGRPSGSVTPADILGCVGAARFFSIDGGHTLEVTRDDLSLAEGTLAPHGVIALDDFLRPEFPDVSAGYFAWLERRSRPIVPFAIGLNKLYLCDESQVAAYQQVLQSCEFLQLLVSKCCSLSAIEIPVFQRFVNPDWGAREQIAEYLKLFHPDLYIRYKSVRSRVGRLLRPRG
jgi:hypothetical protein